LVFIISLDSTHLAFFEPLLAFPDTSSLNRYVDQYQGLLAAPSGLEGIDQNDLEYYEAAVASCSPDDLDEPYLPPEIAPLFEDEAGNANPAGSFDATTHTATNGQWSWQVERYQQHTRDKADMEELYSNYVGRPLKLARSGLQHANTIASKGSSLADPYERWVKGFET
jgi:hypothetical protein